MKNGSPRPPSKRVSRPSLEQNSNLRQREPLLLELLRVVSDIAAVVEREQGGAHVVTNLGKYQESKHLHFHVGAGEVRV